MRFVLVACVHAGKYHDETEPSRPRLSATTISRIIIHIFPETDPNNAALNLRNAHTPLSCGGRVTVPMLVHVSAVHKHVIVPLQRPGNERYSNNNIIRVNNGALTRTEITRLGQWVHTRMENRRERMARNCRKILWTVLEIIRITQPLVRAIQELGKEFGVEAEGYLIKLG